MFEQIKGTIKKYAYVIAIVAALYCLLHGIIYKA